VREVLDRVRREQAPVIVRTYDTPQAVLIPYEEFEAYQAWQDRRQKRRVWLAELRAIAEQVSDRAALTDDEATELITVAPSQPHLPIQGCP
jgi:prevent-host-death family protein